MSQSIHVSNTSALSPSALRRYDQGLKRTIDLVGAILGLLFLSPLLLVIVLLLKVTDGGPAFYGHRRVGRGGREFRCWKFRTMSVRGDTILKAHLERDPAAALEWRATRKLRHDPRVTSVGRVLRRLSLDELPQLFNILTGEMSIVGPRPVVTDELFHYGADEVYYLKVRPGLTGLWQVSGRSDLSYEHRVELDRRYVERWTLSLDALIIIRTVPAVCLARGSC